MNKIGTLTTLSPNRPVVCDVLKDVDSPCIYVRYGKKSPAIDIGLGDLAVVFQAFANRGRTALAWIPGKKCKLLGPDIFTPRSTK